MRLRPFAPFALAYALSLGCAHKAHDLPARPDAAPSASAHPLAAPSAPRPRLRVSHAASLDGHAFPDHALALTWDDGPDVHTKELAAYLAELHVSATFFVVGAWVPGVSDEPGEGDLVKKTGYTALPVLRDIVALGHRLGNHTYHHALLANATSERVRDELINAQREIDPFLTNELRLFRAPGGAWDAHAASVVDDDPLLSGFVGPFRWDIDGKDWSGSLFCDANLPESSCEPLAPKHARRVRPDVVAARTLEEVSKAGRGIALFHDRVGDVGSTYALDLAHKVVPALLGQGYVFTAPVLSFSVLRPRLKDKPTRAFVASLDPATVTLLDVDHDGHADLCGVGADGPSCAQSVMHPENPRVPIPETTFVWSRPFQTNLRLALQKQPGPPLLRGDLNGDGRVDTCELRPAGVFCALMGPRGPLEPTLWLDATRYDVAQWMDGRFLLADINGDGRADLCDLSQGEVACALAP